MTRFETRVLRRRKLGGVALPALGQSTVATWPGSSATTTVLAYGQAPKAGSALVAFTAWNNAAVTCSLADDRANAWAAAGGPQTGVGVLAGFRIQAFIAPNVGALLPTVTATFSLAVGRRGLLLVEFSGVTAAPADGNAYNAQTGVNPSSVGPITTTVHYDALACAAIFGGGPTSAVSPWQAIFLGDGSTPATVWGGNGFAVLFDNAAGPYSGGFNTGPPDDVLLAMVALKGSAA